MAAPLKWTGAFVLVRRLNDGKGTLVPLSGVIIKVRSLVGSFMGTLPASGPTGFVPFAQVISGSDGQEVELYHDTYAGTCRQVLKASVAQAEITTREHTFIVDDLNTSTTEPDYVDLYLSLDGNYPAKVGTGKVGQTVAIPYESNFSRSPVIYPVPRSTIGLDSLSDFRKYTGYAVTSFGEIGGVGGANNLLLSFVSDVSLSTADPIPDLYSGGIPGDTFDQDGAVIWAVFSTATASNNNSKTFALYLGSTVLGSITITDNNKKGELKAYITRSASTSLKISLEYTSNIVVSAYSTATGFDFTAAMVLRLVGSGVADSDVQAKFGFVKRFSAPPAGASFLWTSSFEVLEGDPLVFLTE